MNKLSLAIEQGDLETVKNLIEVEGYSPEYTGYYWFFDTSARPIVISAHYNQPEIMNYLIEKGANINQVWGDIAPPIKHALQFQHVPVVSILLANNAALPEVPWGTENDRKKLITEYVLKSIDANDVSSLERLLTYKPELINTKDISNNGFDSTLLHRASEQGKLDIASKLIELGANVNQLDSSNHTAIHTSVLKGNINIISLLLESGANIDFSDFKNFTPLMLATCFNDDKHNKVIDFLIANGANVNAVSEVDGWTPLGIAASNGNEHAVNALSEAGADLTHKNHDGETAADLALKYGHIELANTLNLQNAEIAVPKMDDTHIEVIEPININEVLMITDGKADFASEVITEHNNIQSADEQVSTYVPEINATLNQTIEQPVVSFG